MFLEAKEEMYIQQGVLKYKAQYSMDKKTLNKCLSHGNQSGNKLKLKAFQCILINKYSAKTFKTFQPTLIVQFQKQPNLFHQHHLILIDRECLKTQNLNSDLLPLIVRLTILSNYKITRNETEYLLPLENIQKVK